MTPKQDATPAVAANARPRRVWSAPSARRLATSEAENSTDTGPDAETVAS